LTEARGLNIVLRTVCCYEGDLTVRHRYRLVAVAAAASLAASAAPAFAHVDGWSQHQCNVAMVTWARQHHNLGKAAFVAYVKQLDKTHGCKLKT
jgi:hypothetical protein